MIKKLDYLKKLEKEKSKRIFHQKYNYLKNNDIEKILKKLEEEKEEKEIKLKYDDEILKNSKLYKLEDIEILEIENKYILIRNDEKRFFFNDFILEIEEYNKNQEKKLSLLEYMKKISNFIIFNELNYIILDIEKDYILKK